MIRRFFLGFVFIFFVFGSLFSPFSIGVHEKTISNEITTVSHTIAISPSIAYADAIGDALEPSLWSAMTGGIDMFMATITYYVLAWPLAQLARLFGMLLDTAISVSIDSATYRNFDFIKEGWRIVRDITNIGFIFALLIVAIGAVLGIERINTKKLLINILVVAFLINFSLFFTRIVVDVSNVLTRVFYNNITVTKADTAPNTYEGSATGFSNQEPKEITVAIMNKINPQRLFHPDFYNQDNDGVAIGKGYIMMIIILELVIINLILVYIFGYISVLFLARILGLAMGMVLAPFALGTLMFPGGSGLAEIGFSAWIKNFLQACFMAPIFMFFIYILLQFMNSDSFMQVSPNAGFWLTLLQITFSFAIVAGLLFMTKEITVKMSGKLGEVTGKAVSGVAKAAVMTGAVVATGGAALAQGTLGAAGAAAAESSGVAELATTQGTGRMSRLKRFAGRQIQSIGSKAATKSFDIRDTVAGQYVAGATGADKGFGGMLQKVGRKSLAGGIEGRRERIEDTKREAAEKARERVELREGEPEMVAMRGAETETNSAQADIDTFSDTFKSTMDRLDKNIANRRDDMRDASQSNDPVAITAAKIKLEAAKAEKKHFDDGTGPHADKVIDVNGTPTTLSVLKTNLHTKKETLETTKTVVARENKGRREQLAGDYSTESALGSIKTSMEAMVSAITAGIGGGLGAAAVGSIAGPTGATVSGVVGAYTAGTSAYSASIKRSDARRNAIAESIRTRSETRNRKKQKSEDLEK